MKMHEKQCVCTQELLPTVVVVEEAAGEGERRRIKQK